MKRKMYFGFSRPAAGAATASSAAQTAANSRSCFIDFTSYGSKAKFFLSSPPAMARTAMASENASLSLRRENKRRLYPSRRKQSPERGKRDGPPRRFPSKLLRHGFFFMKGSFRLIPPASRHFAAQQPKMYICRPFSHGRRTRTGRRRERSPAGENRLILFLPVPIRRTASYRSVLFMP